MSMSSNTSSSTSEPTFLETPENGIIDQISGVAQGLAGQMLDWANGVFAQTSQITNQAVGNFFNVSQKMLGMSDGLTNQYNNLFAPENAQLVADANSYASPARMAVDMGQAGATQRQAGDQALKNSEEALTSYGVNVNDGRYASLDKAMAVQNSANTAGAMNMQRDRDIQIGQGLRRDAVQVGAQLPAAIANINNTALQANTGASNASLANANTGKNLMGLSNDLLKTAMDVKLPPTGQNTRSNSFGSSSSPAPQSGNHSGGGGNGGGGNGAGSPSGPAWMPEHGGAQGSKGGAQIIKGPGSATRTGPEQDPLPDFWRNESDRISDIYKNWPDETSNPEWFGPETGTGTIGPAGSNPDIWGGDTGTGGWNGSFGDIGGGGFGQTYDDGSGGYQSWNGAGGYNNDGYNPGGNSAGSWGDNPFGSGGGDSFSGDNSGYNPGGTDWGSGGDQYSGGGGGYDTSSPSSSYYGGDYSSPVDDSSYDMGGAYSKGGPIPPSMSPSGGAVTDDIPAQGPNGQPMQMNANEFVIPDDVARWKGQEFFQKLIEQSRKARVTAPAKPTRPMGR